MAYSTTGKFDTTYRWLSSRVTAYRNHHVKHMTNYFDAYNWDTMLSQHPASQYDISEYFEILCSRSDYPSFLDRYIQLPVMQRLAGVGLLCGTDWTPLYRNRFYYSRLDHSKGVALIVWHFSHNKAQTIAGLLHDISTPVFSHVSDFRKGDALTQTATEEPTARIIRGDAELSRLLAEDGLSAEEVEDYHIYPIADNEIPQLSADRLEYMFPSGMALDGSWTMEEIRRCYNDLVILKNEYGADELGFRTLEVAELYCEHFCMIGHILQLNENKLTLHMLGQIMNMAEKAGVVSESDFMTLSEKEVMEKLNRHAELVSASITSSEQRFRNKFEMTTSNDVECHCEAEPKQSTSKDILSRYYKTFRTMTKIEHTNEALPENEYFCVNLKVKQRYINPLVVVECPRSGCIETTVNHETTKSSTVVSIRPSDYSTTAKAMRLSEVSEKARRIIEDFKTFSDTPYGCVKLI